MSCLIPYLFGVLSITFLRPRNQYFITGTCDPVRLNDRLNDRSGPTAIQNAESETLSWRTYDFCPDPVSGLWLGGNGGRN
ncbi:hypothetical protein PM082_011511 [Marasmius tenuissimus]|nr:hypothetical protein PM082_011511 [Marasmius tenuissimus]